MPKQSNQDTGFLTKVTAGAPLDFFESSNRRATTANRFEEQVEKVAVFRAGTSQQSERSVAAKPAASLDEEVDQALPGVQRHPAIDGIVDRVAAVSNRMTTSDAVLYSAVTATFVAILFVWLIQSFTGSSATDASDSEILAPNTLALDADSEASSASGRTGQSAPSPLRDPDAVNAEPDRLQSSQVATQKSVTPVRQRSVASVGASVSSVNGSSASASAKPEVDEPLMMAPAGPEVDEVNEDEVDEAEEDDAPALLEPTDPVAPEQADPEPSTPEEPTPPTLKSGKIKPVPQAGPKADNEID